MKPTVHTILAKQDDSSAMSQFLRQIPNGHQFRFELARGRDYRTETYDRGSMTGYYIHADGDVAHCWIVTNLFAHQHQAVTDYYSSRQLDPIPTRVTEDLE